MTIQQAKTNNKSKISLSAARKWCKRLALSHYENFNVASLILDPMKQEELFALYAFARVSDDLADEYGDMTQEEARKRLDTWKKMLDSVYDGNCPNHPAFIALEPLIHAHRIEKELFDRLLEAFRSDLSVKHYDTWKELRRYTTGSADPVGRLVLRLYNLREERLDQLSDSICTGLQLINFIQDIQDDFMLRNRIYLPLEDLERFGVKDWMIPAQPISNDIRNLLAFEAERAEALLDEGRELLELVPDQLKRQLHLFIGGGQAALFQLRSNGYNPAGPGGKVSTLQKIALMFRAWRGMPV